MLDDELLNNSPHDVRLRHDGGDAHGIVALRVHAVEVPHRHAVVRGLRRASLSQHDAHQQGMNA